MPRIGLLLRPDADARPGGDVVQARAVARYLRERGATVTELSGWNPDLTGCDLAIVMNLTVPEQAWLHAHACVRARVPYLLLPVFWDLTGAIPAEHRPTASSLLPVGSRRRGAAQRLRLALQDPRAVSSAAGRRLPWYGTAADRALVQDVVSRAAFVCPNSRAELEHLAEFTRETADSRWVVLHNGFWADELPSVPAAAEVERQRLVISVGAVSPRKNTLGLVRAARQLDCPVVVVGQHPRPGDVYAERVAREAPANVEFRGLLSRLEVLRLMTTAGAHVQPGFVETPGLASLEAVALATPAVVSDIPPVREYFRDEAVYADPHDSASIAQAMLQALVQRPDRVAAERVRHEFDWGRSLRPLDRLLGWGA